MAVCRPLRPAAPRGELITACTSEPKSPVEDAAGAVGHVFSNPALLIDALTHPSALPQLRTGQRRGRRARQPAVRGGYERLEFLGDRVLGLVVADILWRRFDKEPEGHLTRRLTHLVRREALARVADVIGLDRHLVLSPSEAASGAARNPGILADVMEAIIAAIYLDSGFGAAQDFIARLWEPLIAGMDGPPRDPKTTLQEWAQARGRALPAYELVDTSGPDHAPQFTVSVRVDGFDEANATAGSKRAAEIGAAAALLERLSAGKG
ncbi:MAG TPA: ribonuclease III [Stellaceae bacterium]|jgi:ribonuclease-3|nr:ribonuclease III [Stellaceae bacterium]